LNPRRQLVPASLRLAKAEQLNREAAGVATQKTMTAWITWASE
jgi:hypothetical protein